MPIWIQNFLDSQVQVKEKASLGVLGTFLDFERAMVTVWKIPRQQ